MRFAILPLAAALTAKFSMAWSVAVYDSRTCEGDALVTQSGSGPKCLPALQDTLSGGSIRYHGATALAYLKSDCTESADPNGLPPRIKDGECFGATSNLYISVRD